MSPAPRVADAGGGLGSLTDPKEVMAELCGRFPALADAIKDTDAGQQFVEQVRAFPQILQQQSIIPPARSLLFFFVYFPSLPPLLTRNSFPSLSSPHPLEA